MLAARPAHRWFLLGMRGLFTLPALILVSAFVGFTGFAVGAGVPLWQAVLMSGIVFALPGQVLLIGSMMAGASLPAAFLAVSLSAIRMAPMAAALVPELRTKRTPSWLLLLGSHFVAVTAWVYTMQRLPQIPREGRLPFFAGLGVTLVSVNMVVVTLCYGAVAALPPTLEAALFFLTPIYFMTSLWASGRERLTRMALIIGVFIAPLFHLVDPRFDLLYAGLVGGTLAFLADRGLRRKGAVRLGS
ncbi:MAG: AzlC family ABC transporter permease [Pararhizobium sp.]